MFNSSAALQAASRGAVGARIIGKRITDHGKQINCQGGSRDTYPPEGLNPRILRPYTESAVGAEVRWATAY